MCFYLWVQKIVPLAELYIENCVCIYPVKLSEIIFGRIRYFVVKIRNLNNYCGSIVQNKSSFAGLRTPLLLLETCSY